MEPIISILLYQLSHFDMKYIMIMILSIAIFPNISNAANTNFNQQIRAITQCNDSIDNDGDGLLDFASDPDCISWEDTNESTEITPSPQPQPKPNPEPEIKPISQPSTPEQNKPLPNDYIDTINPIQYTIENPSTQQSNIAKQPDTYEDRARLDSIFSVIMIGVLSLGLWFWDFFLNTIPK
jgi:hypothetical protein